MRYIHTDEYTRDILLSIKSKGDPWVRITCNIEYGNKKKNSAFIIWCINFKSVMALAGSPATLGKIQYIYIYILHICSTKSTHSFLPYVSCSLLGKLVCPYVESKHTMYKQNTESFFDFWVTVGLCPYWGRGGVAHCPLPRPKNGVRKYLSTSNKRASINMHLKSCIIAPKRKEE